MNPSRTYGYIVSIDFGTTFSGSCYVTVDDKETEDINIIQNDPKLIQTADLDRENIINIEQWNEDKGSKTPTVVVYDEHMHLSYWGKAATTHIATKKSRHDIVLEKFKLKLPKSVSQRGAVLVSGNTEQGNEEANMRATIDFFRVVYDQIFKQIHFHKPSSKIEFTEEDIRFVITVPAIWNDVERTIMRNVAVSAGLISEKDHENRLIIINESLAAALYCERETAENKIQIGTNYIVCDAGGGYVNVASFIAAETFEESKSFTRCQLTADTGERCGSIYLDEGMKELLMRVLFRPNDMSIYHSDEQKEEFGKLGFIDYLDEERKELDIIVAELLKQFNEDSGFKYNFPAPVSFEHIDQTPTDESSKDDDTQSDDEPEIKYCSDSDSSYSSDEDESDEDREEEMRNGTAEDDPYRTNVTTFRITTRNDIEKIRFQPVSEARYFEDPTSENGIMLLQVSYETMRTLVFDPVISTTIKLLDRQIKKIKEPISATFLFGGFGRNPYLRYTIKDKFKMVDEDGKVIGYRCGTLYDNDRGNLAVMRGALYYGLDGLRQTMQPEIIPIKIISKNPHLTVCIDIRQDKLLYSCVTLKSDIPISLQSKKMETIVLERKLYTGGKITVDLEQYLYVGFSLLRKSLQKSNCITDVGELRYCVLLNPFVVPQAHYRKRIRRTAVDSLLISANDHADRLLFINHDDAIALNIQHSDVDNMFMQDNNIYRMIIIIGDGFVEIAAYQNALLNSIENQTSINIRKIVSSVFSFDTKEKLLTRLDSLIATKAVECHCSSLVPHDRYNRDYFQDLKKLFFDFLEKCDLTKKNSIHEFVINQNGCCKIFVPSKQLWESVLKPVSEELIKYVQRSILGHDVIRSTRYERVDIVGDLVNATTKTSELLRQFSTKTLSKMWDIDCNIIHHTKYNAMDGAALFVAKPESYNERFARRTYAVALEAVERNPFEPSVKEEIDNFTQGGGTFDQIYEVESQNAFPTSHSVQLFYEETSEQFITTSQNVCADDAYPFIFQGERFSEKEHLQGGIRKVFYALEECIVYADIYTTSKANSRCGLNSLPKSKLQRRHRFEIYLKGTTKLKARQPIYFEIHLYTKSNEILFDVQLYPKLASGCLQFRLPDGILVSNVLEDEAILAIPESLA